jgi:hypothetical protein
MPVNVPSVHFMAQLNASERMLERIRDPYIIGQLYSVRFADGSTMQIHYGGQLASPAELPQLGYAIGDSYAVGAHLWIWMQPAGAPIPSWMDP